MLDISKKSIYNNVNKNKELEEWEQIPLFIHVYGRCGLANIEERVESLLEKTIEELGYQLYDVEYAKEGKDYFLRIFIDKADGIDLNDCEKVNDAINDLLDEADYIKEQYFLEVSSPGIERNIRKEKHLKQNIGKKVEVRLFKPIDGTKQYIGILKQYDSNNVVLEQENEVTIERKNIAQIKTIYEW